MKRSRRRSNRGFMEKVEDVTASPEFEEASDRFMPVFVLLIFVVGGSAGFYFGGWGGMAIGLVIALFG